MKEEHLVRGRASPRSFPRTGFTRGKHVSEKVVSDNLYQFTCRLDACEQISPRKTFDLQGF
jgi:hypothetical protein